MNNLLYQSLNHIVHQINSNIFTNNEAEFMDELYDVCITNAENDSQKLLTVLILNALKKRFNPDSIQEHIYTKKFGITQIELFESLIQSFPFVKWSQNMVNYAMLNAMEKVKEVTLIDIGIGQGTQIAMFLKQAKCLPALQKLHIIGIEPFAPALEKATITLNSLKNQVPFEYKFTPIKGFIEQMDISQLQVSLSDVLIVNASLSLHHIQDSNERDELFKKIKTLNPKAFILTEPNSNHYSEDLHTRFKNCFKHYFAIFNVIDKLDCSQNEKHCLKIFFGREIDDILGKKENDRFEKHETTDKWLERLKNNGFNLKPSMLVRTQKEEYGIQVKHHDDGYVSFSASNEHILSLLYSTSMN
jgi:hypothetical protein